MEYAVNNRLKKFLHSKELREKDLIKILGVSDTTVSLWFTNRRSLPFRYIPILKQAFPDINESWLLNGEGSMLIQLPFNLNSYDKIEFCPEQKSQIEEIKSQIIELQNRLLSIYEAGLEKNTIG